MTSLSPRHRTHTTDCAALRRGMARRGGATIPLVPGEPCRICERMARKHRMQERARRDAATIATARETARRDPQAVVEYLLREKWGRE